jgi:hypothetical protein
MARTAAEVFNSMEHEERLKLLEVLGFEEPQRYLHREERQTRFEQLLYEVQIELQSCYQPRKETWKAP